MNNFRTSFYSLLISGFTIVLNEGWRSLFQQAKTKLFSKSSGQRMSSRLEANSNPTAFTKMNSYRNDDYRNVGKYTYGHKEALLYATCKVRIGAFCSIAQNVQIGVAQHDITAISPNHFYEDNQYGGFTSKNNRENFYSNNREVVIGNDVWIGTNVVIMPNVTIGSCAVIGAGSIVTKDVPCFAVVVGVPAKIRKYKFSEDERKLIQLSQWWNWNDAFIKSNIAIFKNNDHFFKFVKDNLELINHNLEFTPKRIDI